MSNSPAPPGNVSPQWVPPPPGYHPGYPQPPYRPLPPALAPNGQPLASFSDRFLAYLIDYGIYIGVSLLWTIPFTIWWFIQFTNFMDDVMRRSAYDPNLPYTQPPEPDFSGFLNLYLPFLIFTLGAILLGAIYTYLYWVEYQFRKGGQTVGKRVMKLRVIPVEPGAAELGRGDYVKRWAVQWLIGLVVSFFHLLDGLWQLWDKPLQQCLHDKAAKTVVVKVG